MGEIDLDAVQARADVARAEYFSGLGMAGYMRSSEDVPALVARVRELEAVEGIALAEVERAIWRHGCDAGMVAPANAARALITVVEPAHGNQAAGWLKGSCSACAWWTRQSEQVWVEHFFERHQCRTAPESQDSGNQKGTNQ